MADRTDSNTLADADAAEAKGMAAARAARMHALAGVETAATIDVGVPNAEYQVRLQKAAGQYTLAQARAQNALQLGGSAADFTAAMQAAQYARTSAEHAAASDFALADITVESQQRLAAADANRDFELAIAGAMQTRQTTESLADRNDAVTVSGAAHDLAISTTVLDREYALFEASGLDGTLAVLAVAHPSAWAHEQSLTAHAAAVTKAATAVAFADQQIASADSGLAYYVSTADIKLAFDTAVASSNADAETAQALNAHVNAVAQIESDATLAMLGAMPLHPQSIVPPSIVSAASVTTYSPLSISTPDPADPVYSNLVAALFQTRPTPNNNAPEELRLPDLVQPTPSSSALSAQEPGWLISTSTAHLTNARTTLGSAEVSVVGAFFTGLTAGAYSVLDAYTPDFLVDVQEAKAQAWQDAGLKDSWTQAISEGAANISREAAINVATAGLGNLATCSRVAYGALVATKVTLAVREAHEGYQNVVAAAQAYNEGSYASAAYHAALAAMDVLSFKDVLKFPAPQCFPAGTLVSTETGLKSIEQIRAGENVWAFDLTTGTWHLRPVLETYEFDDLKEIVEITVAGEVIGSTKGHPFWVIEGEDLHTRPWPEHILGAQVPESIVPGRWVDSHDLRAGDVLLLKDGKPKRVLSTAVRDYSGLVYNFAVEGLACYAVGTSQVLVHNSCNVPKPTGTHSRALGNDLEASGFARPKDWQASHIVPTNLPRSQSVRQAVDMVQKKFDKYLGAKARDQAINGFWSTPGHAGTHSDTFYEELGKAFRTVDSEASAIRAMNRMWRRIESGEFWR